MLGSRTWSRLCCCCQGTRLMTSTSRRVTILLSPVLPGARVLCLSHLLRYHVLEGYWLLLPVRRPLRLVVVVVVALAEVRL